MSAQTVCQKADLIKNVSGRQWQLSLSEVTRSPTVDQLKYDFKMNTIEVFRLNAFDVHLYIILTFISGLNSFKEIN